MARRTPKAKSKVELLKKATKRVGAKMILAGIAVALLVSLLIGNHFAKSRRSIAAPVTKVPKTLAELCALSSNELEQCDIALINLLCAEGLPGSEGLDVQQCLRELDGWTQMVERDTKRFYYRFVEHPEQFRHSLAMYRMNVLGGVLAQDLGIRYNPRIAIPQLDGKLPGPDVYADAKDVFIHGLFSTNHYGTCASMPVLYVAIARRLGYPVQLASTKYHYYVRYEENGGHLNVEPTMTAGFLTPTDDDYKNGLFTSTDEEIAGYGWHRPMSNREMLSHFLDIRFMCLKYAKRWDEAEKVVSLKSRFVIDTLIMRRSIADGFEEIKDGRVSDRWEEVNALTIPEGPRSTYFENRKVQVRYFINVCGDRDRTASHRAADDLIAELAEYRTQLARQTNSPSPGAREPQPVLEVKDGSGKRIKLPAAVLPPPLNRGVIPRDYLDAIASLKLEGEGAVTDEFWRHYKKLTANWMEQVPLLRSSPVLPASAFELTRASQMLRIPTLSGKTVLLPLEALPADYRQRIPPDLLSLLSTWDDAEMMQIEINTYHRRHSGLPLTPDPRPQIPVPQP